MSNDDSTCPEKVPAIVPDPTHDTRDTASALVATRPHPHVVIGEIIPRPPAELAPPAPVRRRGRSGPRNPHAGVTILRPRPEYDQPHWRLRWRDPETGKYKHRVLLPHEAKNEDTRRAAAVAQRKILDRRLAEINDDGATPHRHADMAIAEAFKEYFDTWAAAKADRTRSAYRAACDLFLEWCNQPRIKIRTVRDLSRGTLRKYAGWRVQVRLSVGEAKSTVNRDLRWLSAVLGELRKMEVVAMSRGDLYDGLAKIDEPITKRVFLRPTTLREVIAACRAFDAKPYRGRCSGRMLPIVLWYVLTGLRCDEGLGIEWRDIERDDDGHGGHVVRIRVRAEVSKTGVERYIDTEHSPLLAHLVSDPRGRTGPILAGLSKQSLTSGRTRLIAKFGAPEFCYQELRCTCGTFLTCAPSIFIAASAYMSAAQLGHSVEIAQKHYVGVIKISRDAHTTEGAMQLDGAGQHEVNPANYPRL